MLCVDKLQKTVYLPIAELVSDWLDDKDAGFRDSSGMILLGSARTSVEDDLAITAVLAIAFLSMIITKMSSR